MKKKLIALILLSAMLRAQSFHTVAIDGTNDFSAVNEKCLTTSGTQSSGYITWDASYLYIGYSGNTPSGKLTDANRVIHIYFDTDPKQIASQGTGTTDGEAWRWDPVLPFSANYHYAFKTADNFEVRRQYTGTSWQDATFATANWKADGYWELRIPLADIGSPKQINILSYIEEDWDQQFGSQISSGMPAGLFTNTNMHGAITFNSTWLNYYLVADINPNAAFHLANYQWQIRLKASVGSVSDTANYAGMARNATNGWDAGIDLPKPPTPPSNYIEVYFPHTEWASALGPKFSRDIKSLAALDSTTSSWDLTVNTDRANANVSVTLDEFGFLPASYNIKLHDLSRDSVHNVRAGNTYIYNSGTSAGMRQFKLIIGVTLSAPNIQPGASAINFGTVRTNRDSVFNLTVTNTGDSVLRITNVAVNNSVFSYTGNTSYVLTTNQSVTLPVKFSPRSSGTFNGSIVFTSNDPDTPVLTIPLMGIGQTLTPVLGKSTTQLSFGSVKVTKDSTLSLKVYNTGDTTLVVLNMSLGNSVFSLSTPSSFSVNPGDSSTVSVRFAPTAASAYNSYLRISNNSVNKPADTVFLTGTGIAQVAKLTLSASSLAYGNVGVGSDSSRSVYARNTGETQLTVFSFVSSNAAFRALTAAPLNILPGDSAAVSIKFSPAALAQYSGTVKFISNDPDTAVLSVSGTGVPLTLAKQITQGWNLFSIPVVPENNLAAAVIGDDITPFSLLKYNQTGGYVTSPTVNPGYGYWLGLETPALIDVTGLSASDSFSVSTAKGWNILASPFTKNYRTQSVLFNRNAVTVGPDSAAALGWIQTAYYGYNKTSAGYFTADTLKIWSGYWFATLTDSVRAIFFRQSAVGEQLENSAPIIARGGEDMPLAVNDWAAGITAALGESRDALLYFGAAANATDGFDSRYDFAKPPISPTAAAIESYFEEQQWNELFTKYASDIRAKFEYPAPGKSWRFKLFTKTAGTLSLSWNDILTQIPESVRAKYKFELTGSGIPQPVNMLLASSVSMPVQANSVSAFSINAVVTGVEIESGKPTAFALYQNYPNPFNPSTEIRYALPQDGFVTLKVYDVLGNEVRTLVNQFARAGEYTAVFDAAGLTSGVYFYKLSAWEKSLTKKLLLTK